MGYSRDLGVRRIQVFEDGAAPRAAARQFVIGDSTAIRWAKRWRETGSVEAKSIKGQSRSPLKKHEEWLLDLVQRHPDLTLEEIQGRLLDERQQKAGIGSVWRFFDRHAISFKKKRAGCRFPSAEGRLSESLHFAESDVILGVVRARRSVHKVGYGHNHGQAASPLVAG